MIIHDFEYINGKRIAILGGGTEGERFFYYLRERSYIVSKVFDNYKVGSFHGFEIEKVPNDQKKYDYFYLITSEKYYKEIKKQLEKRGLREYNDFAFSYEGIKRIAIINANCYGIIIGEYLRSSKAFSENYFIHSIPPIYENTQGFIANEVLKQCDLFIHQDIRRDNKYGKRLSDDYIRRQLKSTCVDITIPNLVGMGSIFYPFMERRKVNNVQAETYFPFADKRIDELYARGKSTSEIVGVINNVSLSNDIYIRDNMRKVVEKFKKREEHWDIKVIDYILDNYQKRQFFYDPYHPVNEVLEIISNGILRSLGFDRENLNAEQDLGASEMYLYPDVKAALGLQYDSREIRKKSFYKLTSEMNLEEYVKQYLFFNE